VIEMAAPIQMDPTGPPVGAPVPAPQQAAEPLVFIGNPAPAPMLNGFVAHRPAFAHVQVMLGEGQQVKSDGAAMIWMDGSIPINTHLGGGCSDACWRSCAGESPCQNTYTGPGNVAFSMKLPGDILPFGVGPGQDWVINAGSFIAGTENIKVSCKFSGCTACTCGGEDPFITHISCEEGNGMFYAGGYGKLTRHEIPEGKSMLLSSGLFFAANADIKASGKCPGGFLGCCFGGEGIVMKFDGPCTLYSQNRNPAIWNYLLSQKKRINKTNKGANV
jgi:uncharacterized protein (AIM24 family)